MTFHENVHVLQSSDRAERFYLYGRLGELRCRHSERTIGRLHAMRGTLLFYRSYAEAL